MTAQEAYNYGFCKAAADAGVNPAELVKLARPKGVLKRIPPEVRSSVLAGLLAAAATYAGSEGQISDRIGKGVIGGALGAGGMYAAEKTGLTRNALDFAIRHLVDARLERTPGLLPIFKP